MCRDCGNLKPADCPCPIVRPSRFIQIEEMHWKVKLQIAHVS